MNVKELDVMLKWNQYLEAIEQYGPYSPEAIEFLKKAYQILGYCTEHLDGQPHTDSSHSK
jgi:hypothetical protein